MTIKTQKPTQQIGVALAESAISNTVSSTTQSAISGESLSDTSRNLARDIVVGAASNLIAKEIGRAVHGNVDDQGYVLNNDGTRSTFAGYEYKQIGKPTQLTLHAMLGCASGAAGGGDCASGAVAGMTGELAAEFADQQLGANKQQSIEFAGLAGGFSTIFTGNVVGLSDSEIAENIYVGQRVGKNAGENNTFYVSKENQRIVATDGVNNHKIILISDEEENSIRNKNTASLFNERYSTTLEQAKDGYYNTEITLESYMNDDAITEKYFIGPNRSVSVVSLNYQNQTNGQSYSLRNRNDFYELSLLTGQYGMEYSREISNVLFNDYNDLTRAKMNYANENYLLSNQYLNDNNPLLNIANNYNNINNSINMTNTPIPTNTNIFFQNGMMNNYKTAGEIATLISETTNRPTAMIVNNTGMINDILEYIPDDLVLRDALNGEVYQQIDRYNLENNQRSLIVTHSAGNNDIMKGNQALQLTDAKVSTISVMNVASPISQSKMQRSFDQTGMNLIGRYNNWKDPVTHSKTWGTVAMGSLAVGLTIGVASGVSTGASMATTGSGLEAIFTGTMGGAVGGAVGGTPSAAGYLLLKYQHPYTSYHNKDFKGLKTDIENWAKANPVSAR